jgi:ceramide glucosyltransferase
MMLFASLLLFAGATVGLCLYGIQLASSRRHLREPAPRPNATPGISILKPLCGIDDELARNLECFATLGYPRYEVLLGVRSIRDAAYPLALAAARRWPGKLRVVLQRGEPGLNPKVNQLVTLASAARYEILVVSDSNVRVDSEYLYEIAATLEDSTVGLVTHPVVGVGELRLGSLLDNLHMAGSVAAGMVGAKRVAKKDIVVGKSMALRRTDLDRLGGFAVVVDVLAEDYVMGRMIPARLGKRVVMAHRAVENVSRERSVGDFYLRYRRWAVIHRQAVGSRVYAAQILLNPSMVALAAFALHPCAAALGGLGAIGALKMSYDLMALRLFRAQPVAWSALGASLLKDAVLAAAWLHGLTRREIVWRSNRLRVLPGTRLALPRQIAAPDAVEADLVKRAA